MMPLLPEDMRFAINDARERHKATVELIAGIDRQALSFLQLYVTLSGAALSGAGFILLSNMPNYPRALGYGLLAFAVPLVVGAVLSIITIWPRDINVPGRDPDFWIWANGDRITSDQVYRAYLDNLAVKVAQNTKLNTQQSRLMLWAKVAGVAAPIAGLLTAAATLVC
jgi:hypothetical protein